MFRRLLLNGLMVFLTATQAVTAAPLDVYILTGQSNSLGTTTLENPYTPGTDPADSVIHIFWANANGGTGWPPVLFGTSANLFKPLQMQQGGVGNNWFWGPEFGFGRTLYAAGSTPAPGVATRRPRRVAAARRESLNVVLARPPTHGGWRGRQPRRPRRARSRVSE